jgi:hypothetical protein
MKQLLFLKLNRTFLYRKFSIIFISETEGAGRQN